MQPPRRPEVPPALRWTRRSAHFTKQSYGLPTVTVLVPCYNYAQYLRQCVESVLAQDGVDLDVLIIDDASTDNSAEVAQELARQDSRVRVIIHDQNKGHIATYNEGIDQIRGKYFVLLSADDFLIPGSLMRATRVMEENDGVTFVYGKTASCRHITACQHVSRPKGRSFEIVDGMIWIERICRLGRGVILSPEVVVRSEAQQQVGGYNPLLPHNGDLEMWLRLASRGQVARLSSIQAFHRIHPASLSRTKYGSVLADLGQRRDAFDSFFEHCTDLVDRARLRRNAMTHIAAKALSRACDALVFRDDDVQHEQYLEFAKSLDVDLDRVPDFRQYNILRRSQLKRRVGPITRLAASYVRTRCRARRRYYELRGWLS